MERKIIQIDDEKCTGCGACAAACHEGAIAMVDGKARLMRDDYCDGFGDCLPACPADAISFVVREAAAYDEAAVLAAKAAKADAPSDATLGGCAMEGAFAGRVPAAGDWTFAAQVAPGAMGGVAVTPGIGGAQPPVHHAGCPGSAMRTFDRAASAGAQGRAASSVPQAHVTADDVDDACSELGQWPCQIKLVPPRAPFFEGADLLVAADCTAFARADFHARFMRGTTCVIGCPKLDAVDYADKLGQIVVANDVRSVRVARMEVPCCGGIERAVREAVAGSGKQVPVTVTVIGVDGRIVEQR